MVLDTVKVSETISGCISSEATKLVEVFPLPTLTLGSNQTICAGASPSDFNVTISNYANISGIGTFTVSYELRAGSATGTPLGGASTATINNINSGTISIPASSFTGFTPGTTYYFVVTNFGSEISATASNPAPGNISSTAVDALPRTYTITVNPAITAPSIMAY
ncbi:MAG: hypothetical protein VKL60_17690 [Sphaerospermopsis sp.]|nr:hypothetical protein [Sphaerospermopsis sp.]